MPEQLAPGTAIGAPMSRVDGYQKVTGTARYAAEHNPPHVAHGVLVTSTIARGRIKNLDTAAAERAPGVLAVLTYRNAPNVPGYATSPPEAKKRVVGEELRVFYNDQVHFNNQPVALAIANTLEQAHAAAALVRVTYAAEPHRTELAANLSRGIEPKRSEDYARGQANAYRTAPVQVEHTYSTPMHVHNPLEMHAAVAEWTAPDRLTVYNKTQAPKLAQQDHMRYFDLAEANVQVYSPFVGGAFGSSSRVWPQEMAAVLGAKLVGRPVKVMLERPQEFNMAGYRPHSIQKVGLGAQADGTLVGITHEAHGVTSQYEEFVERILHPTISAYQCPNLNATYRLVPLDMSTPCWMRGPGETTGSFALESAVDELAYQLKMDPLALRLKNYADADPRDGHPWSSKYLRACYQQGAERFGWGRRNPAPRATQQGEWLVGQGMATGIYHASRTAASARAILHADGSLLVQSATANVGPGTATIMTQIAADASGVALENIHFESGNADFPPAPGQFGSHTAASVGSAVHEVCVALKKQVQQLAQSAPNSPLRQVPPTELVAENGAVQRTGNRAARLTYAEVLRQHQLPNLQLTQESKGGDEMKQYSGKSFCANFVEVRVHAGTGEVRVSRVVSALDVGRVLNHKTATSQVYGAIGWGIGMALMEDVVLDHRYGRVVNHNLAEYHVPVNADVPTAIDVIFMDKPDYILDPIGAKGMGEIGLIGFAAAVANAVYHATGKRIRELPITPDKLV